MILCLKIFMARIIDVSIGVLRTVELVKDHTFKAVILAFFEVFIWFLIAKEALTSSEFNLLVAIFYSLGYACGTLVGSYLNKILINGSLTLQVITNKFNQNNIKKIKKEGFGISFIKLDGKNKKMLIIEVNKKRLKSLINFIKDIDNKSFIIASESKFTSNGYIR